VTFEEWLAENGESASVTTRKKMKAAYEAGQQDIAGNVLALLGQDATSFQSLLDALKAAGL
jgi:hypothetical protein